MTGPGAATGRRIEVSVPDEAWASAVRGLFPADRVEVIEGEGRSGRPEGSRRIDVSRAGEAYAIRCGPGVGFGTEPMRLEGPGEAISRLELLLTRALLRDHPDRVHLHAAGAQMHGVGVLALGAAGAGKSSLALAWSRSGWPLLGDDVVLVGEKGRARPFFRLMKVDVERLSEHGIRREETHAWVPGWEEAWIDPRAGGGWSEGPCPVGLVVLLDRTAGGSDGGPRATELESGEALSVLLESSLPGGLQGAASLDALCRLLDGTRSLRLSFGSSREAAAFLAREARRSAPRDPREGPDA